MIQTKIRALNSIANFNGEKNGFELQSRVSRVCTALQTPKHRCKRGDYFSMDRHLPDYCAVLLDVRNELCGKVTLEHVPDNAFG